MRAQLPLIVPSKNNTDPSKSNAQISTEIDDQDQSVTSKPNPEI